MRRAKRKKTIPEKVPVSSNGDVLRTATSDHPHWSDETRPFLATLALHRYPKFASSRRLRMIDVVSGKKYPMFESDFFEMVSECNMYEGQISGQWGFCKKSAFYGIYLISSIDM